MPPQTDCPLCWHTEATRRDRFSRWLGDLLAPRPALATIIAEHARAMSAILSVAETGWYGRHRRAFVDDGNWDELPRMLRHVRNS